MVELAHETLVAFCEDGMEDGEHSHLLLTRERKERRIPHQVRNASLPDGFREGLLYGAAQSPMGIRRDAEGAFHTALTQ